MKILQLTNKPPWPAKDGGAIAVLNLTKGFAALEQEVTVLAMNTRKHHTTAEEIPEDLKKKVRVLDWLGFIRGCYSIAKVPMIRNFPPSR